MDPIASLPPETARQITTVLTDIDGTLTHDGKLLAPAYTALWRLREAGIRVVPVTGRPAGWCDLIARQWPVDAVVGENGALVFYEENGRLRRFHHPDVASADVHSRLEAVRRDVLANVTGSRVATDQAYRQFDLAIDFCEEPPDLGLAAADEIRGIFERHGAHAKISDIHVNGWFGDYDKLSMFLLFAREVWGEDVTAQKERYLYCGDSPNDEPMFAFFANACGVANVEAFRERIAQLPRFVARAEGGEGFAEIVDVLLSRRRS